MRLAFTLRQLTHASRHPWLMHRAHGFSSSHLTLDQRQAVHASEIVLRLQLTLSCLSLPPPGAAAHAPGSAQAPSASSPSASYPSASSPSAAAGSCTAGLASRTSSASMDAQDVEQKSRGGQHSSRDASPSCPPTKISTGIPLRKPGRMSIRIGLPKPNSRNPI